MPTDEKIRELARILAEVVDMLECVLPHNCRSYLRSLREQAEELAKEDAE